MNEHNETSHPYRNLWKRVQASTYWHSRRLLVIILGALVSLIANVVLLAKRPSYVTPAQREAAWINRDRQMSRVAERVDQEAQAVYHHAFGNRVIFRTHLGPYTREVDASPEWVTILTVENALYGGERVHSVSCRLPVRGMGGTQEVLWDARPICVQDCCGDPRE